MILNSGSRDIRNKCRAVSYFNGYLADEDYFADCSGGGGSTTNSEQNSILEFLNNVQDNDYFNPWIKIYNIFSSFESQLDFQVPDEKLMYVVL